MNFPSSLAAFARPARLLLHAGLICLVIALLSGWFMTRQPWLGVQLQAEAGQVKVAGVAARLQDVLPRGATLTGISIHGGEVMPLRAGDLVEEPDFLDTYEEVSEFFQRQTRFMQMLRAPEVTLHYQEGSAQSQQVAIVPVRRPLSSLPFTFFLQLLCGCIALLITVWVYALRPGDWATRAFLSTGVFFMLAASTAAIYSSRELALPGGLFHLLSVLDHAGAILFGASVLAVFLRYPHPLVEPRMLIWLPLVFVPWWIADSMQWPADVDWGYRHPLSLQLVLAVVISIVQWRISRHRPLDRAALYWFTLAALVSCALFVMTGPAANALKLYAPVPQSYAFAYFLIMYIGIALGLGRYRLFDLDVWAYRVLLWVGGALLVVVMDVALITFGMGEGASLGAALLVCGWLYFPLRQWLWQRIVNSNVVRLETLLPQMSELVFMPTCEAREAHWDTVLRRMFDPLEVRRCEVPCAQPAVLDDGLALCLPALGGMQARSLRFAAGGRRLFSTRDAAFAATLCHLAEQVLSGREGYERGVQQERQRLARDLHDNIGARLLRLIHHLRGTPDAEIARDAMKDLRAAISAIDAPPAPLQEALADWRAEADARCAAANVELRWAQHDLPQFSLQPRIKAAVGSALREAVTNALKHAAPSRIDIRISSDGTTLQLVVTNDGAASDPSRWQEGYGLRSIRGRLHDLGGALDISAQGDTVWLHMAMPLKGLNP